MKYKEKIILTNEQSFMTVRHIIMKGTNFEIGKQLANLAIQNHEFNSEIIKSDNPVLTKAQHKYLEKNYPIHLDRARGVAQSLNLDFEIDQYDFTSLPYNQYFPLNVAIGCSSIFLPPSTTSSGHGYLSRNFDFPKANSFDLLGVSIPSNTQQTIQPLLGDPYVVEMYPEEEGYASLYLSSFDLLSGVLDGINSEGLIVCVNGDEIAMSQQQGNPEINPNGIGLHELHGMRLLLDTCATVEEAKKTLLINKHYYSFMPCHYIIADRFGKSFVYEHTHGRNNEYLFDNKNEPQVITNHPLYLYPSMDHFPEKLGILEAGTSSFLRYKKVIESIETGTNLRTDEFLKNTCNSVSTSKVAEWIPASYRQEVVNTPGFSRTLWHSLYNTDARSLEIKFYLNDEEKDNGNYIECYSDYFQFNLEY
ncbi:MAG: carcinine hydrolase/isopenicillin-N N-acyltransferase family protein [Candidatus Hodarchaeales archaeon]|jgi:hypothetical protein